MSLYGSFVPFHRCSLGVYGLAMSKDQQSERDMSAIGVFLKHLLIDVAHTSIRPSQRLSLLIFLSPYASGGEHLVTIWLLAQEAAPPPPAAAPSPPAAAALSSAAVVVAAVNSSPVMSL